MTASSAAFLSTGIEVVSNTSRGNGFAGIYIGDTTNADAKVRANDTSDNALGMFFHNSSQGSIGGNKVHDNCAGMVFLAQSPGSDGQYEVSGNQVRNNTRSYPGPTEADSLSGIGIVLLGSRGMEITGNNIEGNKPSGSTAFRGGVVVVCGFEGTPPTNNSVSGNNFLGNSPDIFWDESGSGNSFTANNCQTSSPARICG